MEAVIQPYLNSSPAFVWVGGGEGVGAQTTRGLTCRLEIIAVNCAVIKL